MDREKATIDDYLKRLSERYHNPEVRRKVVLEENGPGSFIVKLESSNEKKKTPGLLTDAVCRILGHNWGSDYHCRRCDKDRRITKIDKNIERIRNLLNLKL